jgi:hypothetical protein
MWASVVEKRASTCVNYGTPFAHAQKRIFVDHSTSDIQPELALIAPTPEPWFWIPLEACMSAFLLCLCCPVYAVALRWAPFIVKAFRSDVYKHDSKTWKAGGLWPLWSAVPHKMMMMNLYLYRCNRPRRPIGLWDVEVCTSSRQSAHRWRWGC